MTTRLLQLFFTFLFLMLIFICYRDPSPGFFTRTKVPAVESGGLTDPYKRSKTSAKDWIIVANEHERVSDGPDLRQVFCKLLTVSHNSITRYDVRTVYHGAKHHMIAVNFLALSAFLASPLAKADTQLSTLKNIQNIEDGVTLHWERVPTPPEVKEQITKFSSDFSLGERINIDLDTITNIGKNLWQVLRLRPCNTTTPPVCPKGSQVPVISKTSLISTTKHGDFGGQTRLAAPSTRLNTRWCISMVEATKDGENTSRRLPFCQVKSMSLGATKSI